MDIAWHRRPLSARIGAATAVSVACAAMLSGARIAASPEAAGAPDGYVPTVFRPQEPNTIEAAFPRESYRPGQVARLRLWSPARDATLQVFRIGPERTRTVGNRELRGVPVTGRRRVGSLRPGRVLAIGIGDWPSGLYFARLNGAGARVGFAPFVVAPRRLGVHRIAVVMPTRTWQAYNFRDDDGDGAADTWYADQGRIHTARLGRPYLNRGVPSHFRNYDLHFLNWLHRSGKHVDVLAQEDLDEANGPA